MPLPTSVKSRRTAILIAAGAPAFSAAVELFQLTDVPARLAAVFPASRLVLGTTFAVPDRVA
ncbi:DUF2809 domain-containing protein [Arthrobacter dokdonensis]|uniref:DUF2809 domain-containing protein n=1 Tax=Arthrobacter dokdonellae TaxID=2211210 RepID=UPI000DE5ADEA|nr:DUF2809 domain-containing protein [Arthrobacter dokdonellae]